MRCALRINRSIYSGRQNGPILGTNIEAFSVSGSSDWTKKSTLSVRGNLHHNVHHLVQVMCYRFTSISQEVIQLLLIFAVFNIYFETEP